MRAKLTIAIPTYNRAEKLKECLERVISYSEKKPIEILVSDNASADNTSEIVKVMQTEYPEIRYYRNCENLGFDGNFLNCFEKASGEYIWLLSDDDILLPGAIETILNGCDKNPVCMHLNSSYVNDENPLVIGAARFKDEGLLEFIDKNIFVEKIGIFCTFVSSLVFNLDMVKKINNKNKYFNTNILQSYIYFEVMKNEGVYIIDTFNCLAARGNRVVGYDVLETWIQSYSELLLTTAPQCGFDEHRMSEILRKDLGNIVYEFVIAFRQTCINESKWNRECIWKYIYRYPELVKKYKKAVSCSIKELKILQWKYKFEKKIKNIVKNLKR